MHLDFLNFEFFGLFWAILGLFWGFWAFPGPKWPDIFITSKIRNTSFFSTPRYSHELVLCEFSGKLDYPVKSLRICKFLLKWLFFYRNFGHFSHFSRFQVISRAYGIGPNFERPEKWTAWSLDNNKDYKDYNKEVGEPILESELSRTLP